MARWICARLFCFLLLFCSKSFDWLQCNAMRSAFDVIWCDWTVCVCVFAMGIVCVCAQFAWQTDRQTDSLRNAKGKLQAASLQENLMQATRELDNKRQLQDSWARKLTDWVSRRDWLMLAHRSSIEPSLGGRRSEHLLTRLPAWSMLAQLQTIGRQINGQVKLKTDTCENLQLPEPSGQSRWTYITCIGYGNYAIVVVQYACIALWFCNCKNLLHYRYFLQKSKSIKEIFL